MKVSTTCDKSGSTIGLTGLVPNYSAFKGGIIRSNPRAFCAGGGETAEHADQFGDEADVAQAGNGLRSEKWNFTQANTILWWQG